MSQQNKYIKRNRFTVAILQKQTPLIDAAINGIDTANLKTNDRNRLENCFRFCYKKTIAFGR